MAVSRLIEKGFTPRDVQQKFMAAVEQSAGFKNAISLIHADTGIGKSLGVLAVTLDWIAQGYRVIVATQTHRLIRQLAKVELPLIDSKISPGIYFGLSRYPSKSRIELLLATESFCEDTAQYLLALSSFAGAIDDFIEEFGPLPDEVQESQLCCGHGEISEEVACQRKSALSKKLIFTTHASVINDGLFKGAVFEPDDKTIFVIDEADAFVDSLENMRFQTIGIRDAVEFLLEHASSKMLAPLSLVMAEMTEIAGSPRTPRHADLAREFFVAIRECVDGKKKWQMEFKQNFPVFLGYHPEVCVTASPVRKQPQIIIARQFASKVVSDYLRCAHHCVMISGSLSVKNDPSGMQWAVRSLRLDGDGSTGVMAQFSPTSFGELTFALAAAQVDYPKIYINDGELSKRWISRVAKDINKQTLNSCNRVVVLTGSHKESEALESELKAISETRAISRHASGESIRAAVERFMLEGGILLTAAGHTGLNLVQSDGQLAFSQLFITRIGMAPKDDAKAMYSAQLIADFSPEKDVNKLKVGQMRYEYSRNVVRSVRRIRQAIGRGIRSADHKAHVVICDPRFPLYEDRESKLALLRESIPLRFLDAYKKASEIEEKQEVLF